MGSSGKFEFYVENIKDDTTEDLLEKLQMIGIINVKPFKKIENYNSSTDDEARIIWQKRRYEIIAYNDCLYRNLEKSHFLVPIDVDEVIVPREADSWAQLLHDSFDDDDDDSASYTVPNAYYLRHFTSTLTPLSGEEDDNDNQDVFFFRDVIRSDYSSRGESGKSFVSVKNALTIFNHYALMALPPGVGRNRFLQTEQVQMNHYKNECSVKILPECAKYLSSSVRVFDGVMLRFADRFWDEFARLGVNLGL